MKALKVTTSPIKSTIETVKYSFKKMEWHGNDPVKFNDYPIKTGLGYNRLAIDVAEDEGPFNYVLSVKNSYDVDLGSELILINPYGKYIFGKDMKVIDNFQKEHHIGETLRLSSIMMMLMNNLSKIKIFATNNSVLFHSKYKFLPNITNCAESTSVLQSIVDSDIPRTKSIQKKAQSLMVKAEEVRALPEESIVKQQFLEECNTTIQQFIEKLFENNPNLSAKTQPFSSGFDMVLSREHVIKNKDFFNQKFAEHEIDFEI